jgi:hypothetical protein
MKYVDDFTIWEALSSSCAESSLQTTADKVAQWTTTNCRSWQRHTATTPIEHRQLTGHVTKTANLA